MIESIRSYAGRSLVGALVLTLVMAGAGCAEAEPESAGKADDSKGKIVKEDEEWKEDLTPEQYRILREKGTERAGTGEYNKHYDDGVYVCAGCGNELFMSDDKYDSGSGWPSFTRPAKDGHVDEHADRSLGMTRTEVLCSKCGGHLGHVFEDGPQPTGMRYCINSGALGFEESSDRQAAETELETATLGAGCFWCTEALFETLDGVTSVKSGYMGGHVEDPTYKQVCSGDSGHAEVAQVAFDPSKVSFAEVLDLFWQMHDPTSLNKQGADTGPQYRSAIFYHSAAQKKVAEESKAELQKTLDKKVVTEIAEASEFYEAENYHQDYYRNNSNAPYCRAVIAPKLKKYGK